VERDGSSLTNYFERRGRIPAIESLAAYRFGTAIVGDTGATEREPVTRVSPEFFLTLGTGPAMGRAFAEQETTYDADSVAILSDGYWRQRYHSDARIIGKRIRVDGVSRTVIGVLPPGFRFLSSEAGLYFPLASSAEQRAPLQRHSGGNVTQIIARLRTGASLAQAQAQIDAQNSALEFDDPQAKMMADAGFRTMVIPLHADHVAAIRPTLLLLQAGVLALLLIGAVNLMNLLLIRAGSRIKELAVRQALGASRSHMVSETLVETGLITLLGGLAGVAVGAAGIRLLSLLGTDRLPLGKEIHFDLRTALWGMAAAMVMGLVLATPVAWFNLRGRLGTALHSVNRWGTASRAAQHLRHSFIVAQIALAFILLSGAGLLGLSLKRVMAVSPGFRADHVLTGQISLPGKNYPDPAARTAFTEKLMTELRAQAGVMAAGFCSNVPLSGRSGKSSAAVEGRVPQPGESPRANYSYRVGGDYFGALGFSLKEGRFLNSEDARRAERVSVVDEDFARYYFPDSSALGRRLFQGTDQGKAADAFTIVGVVGNVKQAGLADDAAQGAVYYPNNLQDGEFFVVARTGPPPEALGLTLQKVVRRIDSDLPVNDVQSMDARITDSLVVRRSPAVLAGLFSAIALLLTAIGTYGVLSYAVAQRRREIGVRMALGARPAQIRSQFLSLAGRLMACGMFAGMAGAWLAGQGMGTVLYHVPALDWPVLAGAACVMAVVSMIACVLPSQRAARISPMESLAEE